MDGYAAAFEIALLCVAGVSVAVAALVQLLPAPRAAADDPAPATAATA